MTTIKWLTIKWPSSLSDISKKMLDNQYNDETGRGFLLSSSGKNEVTGRYIEKILQKSLTTDPFGKEIGSLLTTY